jgi:hypothetical protein
MPSRAARSWADIRGAEGTHYRRSRSWREGHPSQRVPERRRGPIGARRWPIDAVVAGQATTDPRLGCREPRDRNRHANGQKPVATRATTGRPAQRITTRTARCGPLGGWVATGVR